jgi:hypothetical protein
MIVQGKLPATRFDGPHGSRWEIAPEALEGVRPKWLIKVKQVPEVAEAVQPEQVERLEARQHEAVDHGGAALLEALQAAARADQRLEAYQQKLEAVQKQALAEARGRMAAELQLQQYQRVLSEQAESAAEERARVKHLEASLAGERALRQAAEASALVVPAVVVPDPALSDLKQDMPTAKRGWGQRLGRWLLGQQTG